MDAVDAHGLEVLRELLRGLHGSVGRRLLSVSLDHHTAGDPGVGLSAGVVGHVEEGVVEGGEDVAHGEDVVALGDGGRAVVNFLIFSRGFRLRVRLSGLTMMDFKLS